jgi:hypothetical protein
MAKEKKVKPITEKQKVMNLLESIIGESDSTYKTYFAETDEQCENLYKGIIGTGEENEADDWRSRLSLGNTFGLVEQMNAITINSFYSVSDFYSIKAFTTESKEKGKDPVVTAKAMETLMKAQEQKMGLYRIVHDSLKTSFIKPLGGWVYITFDPTEKTRKWMSFNEKTKKLEPVEVKYRDMYPKIKGVDPRDMILDYEATCIDDMRGIGHRYSESLTKIMESNFYNDEEGKKELAESYRNQMEKNPSLEPMPRLEIVWVKDMVYVRADGKFLIKNHNTPWKHGQYPYASTIDNPEPYRPFGLSSAQMSSDISSYMNTLANNHIDAEKTLISPMWILKGSSDVNATRIKPSPSLVIRVREGGEFAPVDRPSPQQDTYRMFQQLSAWQNQMVGNLDALDSSNNQTATESKLVFSRSQSRRKVYNDYNKDGFLKRMIYQWIELNQQFVPADAYKDFCNADELKKINFEN